MAGRDSGSSQTMAGPITVVPELTVRPAPTQTGPMNRASGSIVALRIAPDFALHEELARAMVESGRFQSWIRSRRNRAISRSRLRS